MLKKIPVSAVCIGMHVHALEGAWLDHPFWKTRFVLDDPADLERLRRSAVKECWIETDSDTDAGDDVEVPSVPAQAASAVACPEAAESVAPGPAVVPAMPSAGQSTPRAFGDELNEAVQICHRGRQAVTDMFGQARLGRAVDPQGCLPLVEEITASVTRNPAALVSLARLKTRDDYTYMHSVAVCALMVMLARQLGLDDSQTRQAGLAGLLHDMGKALMPEAILNKPGKLTDAEFAVIRTHPERGHAMLLEGGAVPDTVLDVALNHHEKIDGSGYPRRLAGEQISLFARMGAVCDVYDAITSNRAYKVGWDPADSIAKMISWQGHFDPVVLKAFVRGLGLYPTGSVVRLHSQRIAVVVEQNDANLTAPVVRIFYSMNSQMPMAPQRLDLAGKACSDRIVAREPLQDWGGVNVNALWGGDAASARR